MCAGKQLSGVRYLWQGTPCLFKQAAIYSGTDPNLPSPPYLKLFEVESIKFENGVKIFF